MSETRVEFKRTVDQRDGRGKVFAEVTKYPGNKANDKRVAASNLKRSTGKINGVAAVCARVVCPTSAMECLVAKGG